jgi:hypothetical protein
MNDDPQGPIREKEAEVLAIRIEHEHTFDHHPRSFLEMPMGLPRPRHLGTPIPYTTKLDEWTGVPQWKHNDQLRRALCVLDRRCSLCGDPLDDALVMTSAAEKPDPLRAVIDGTAVHPGLCWKLTATVCPGLRRVIDAGRMHIWIVPAADLVIGGAPDKPSYLQPNRPPTPYEATS